MRGKLVDRFWAKVRKSDGCWEWKAALNRAGYGMIGLGGRGDGIERAHRVSWEIHFGTPPGAMFVCHRCDNRRCVRPDHLFLGTNDDNVADMLAKGRGSTPPKMTGVTNCRARVIEFDGRRLCLEDWARLTGIKGPTIRRRLRIGWPVERALTEAAS